MSCLPLLAKMIAFLKRIHISLWRCVCGLINVAKLFFFVHGIHIRVSCLATMGNGCSSVVYSLFLAHWPLHSLSPCYHCLSIAATVCLSRTDSPVCNQTKSFYVLNYQHCCVIYSSWCLQQKTGTIDVDVKCKYPHWFFDSPPVHWCDRISPGSPDGQSNYDRPVCCQCVYVRERAKGKQQRGWAQTTLLEIIYLIVRRVKK